MAEDEIDNTLDDDADMDDVPDPPLLPSELDAQQQQIHEQQQADEAAFDQIQSQQESPSEQSQVEQPEQVQPQQPRSVFSTPEQAKQDQLVIPDPPKTPRNIPIALEGVSHESKAFKAWDAMQPKSTQQPNWQTSADMKQPDQPQMWPQDFGGQGQQQAGGGDDKMGEVLELLRQINQNLQFIVDHPSGSLG